MCLIQLYCHLIFNRVILHAPLSVPAKCSLVFFPRGHLLITVSSILVFFSFSLFNSFCRSHFFSFVHSVMLANAASANYHLMDICRKIIFCDQDYHFRFKLQKLRTNQKSNNLLITCTHFISLGRPSSTPVSHADI